MKILPSTLVVVTFFIFHPNNLNIFEARILLASVNQKPNIVVFSKKIVYVSQPGFSRDRGGGGGGASFDRCNLKRN